MTKQRQHKFIVISGEDINENYYQSFEYTDDSSYNASVAEFVNTNKDVDGNKLFQDTGEYQNIGT